MKKGVSFFFFLSLRRSDTPKQRRTSNGRAKERIYKGECRIDQRGRSVCALSAFFSFAALFGILFSRFVLGKARIIYPALLETCDAKRRDDGPRRLFYRRPRVSQTQDGGCNRDISSPRKPSRSGHINLGPRMSA